MARWWGALLALSVLLWTGLSLFGPWARIPGLPTLMPAGIPEASYTHASALIPEVAPTVQPAHGAVDRVMGYTLKLANPVLASSGLPVAVTPYGVVYVNPSQGSPVTLSGGHHAITSISPFHVLVSRVLQPGTGKLPDPTSVGPALPNRYQSGGQSGWWALSFIRATNQWLVLRETALPAVGPGMSAVDALSLASGRLIKVADIPGGVPYHVAVGSGRVAIGTPYGDTIYLLPSTPTGTVAVTRWPAAWYAATASSLDQGYDTPTIQVPGLPTAPPTAKRLSSYQAGSWQLPFFAPTGWQVEAPVTRYDQTTVTVRNPLAPRQWVRLIVTPSPKMLAVASLPGAVPSVMASLPSATGVWLTDVSVGFALPDATRGYQLNGVIYPAADGGCDEVLVSLPAKMHGLATTILNSVGLPS